MASAAVRELGLRLNHLVLSQHLVLCEMLQSGIFLSKSSTGSGDVG